MPFFSAFFLGVEAAPLPCPFPSYYCCCYHHHHYYYTTAAAVRTGDGRTYIQPYRQFKKSKTSSCFFLGVGLSSAGVVGRGSAVPFSAPNKEKQHHRLTSLGFMTHHAPALNITVSSAPALWPAVPCPCSLILALLSCPTSTIHYHRLVA